MKRLSIFPFIFLAFSRLAAQDNFVDGRIILENGEVIEGQINDQYWEKIPKSFEYKSTAGVRIIAFPKDVWEIKIGTKAIYRSFELLYDSSGRTKDNLPTSKEPTYKKAHLFLKVLVDSDVALLTARINNVDRYFIQRDNRVEELINHPFRIYVGAQELKQENRLYVKQLAQAFSSCPKTQLNTKLEYNDVALKNLFLDYASCSGTKAQEYREKEKVVTLKGIEGTYAYDQMIHDFNGGSGFGVGGFVTVFFPHRVYKNSVYTELSYRKFGDQMWSGVDYVGLPYKETHQVRSIKLTSILRWRLSRQPSLPHTNYIYAGAGLSTSFGLEDLYQRGPYVATSAVPFAGIVLNAGIYVAKNVALDIKLERGSQILYGDYLNQDNREPLSDGYYSVQGSLIIEF